MQQEAARRGVTAPEAPRFSGHRDTDFEAFRARFNAIGAPDFAGALASAAVAAMAKQLHDDHTGFIPASLFAQAQTMLAAPNTTPSQPIFESRLLSFGVGYLQLRLFPAPGARLADGGTLADDLDAALQSFEAGGSTGIILDLRDNPGGALASVSTLTGRFLPPAVVSVVDSRDGSQGQMLTDGHEFPAQHPLAVLVNGRSGSAAEVAAEALKQTGRARLFGSRTAGAVNGAGLAVLPGGAGLLITELKVLAPGTLQPLDGVGVEPDVAIPAGSGGDPALDAAEAWLQSTAAPSLAAPYAPLPPSNRSVEEIRTKLEPYGAHVGDLPPIVGLRPLGEQVVDTPEELVSSQPNALSRAAMVAQTGWDGGLIQIFGSGPDIPYQVTPALFGDSASAARAFHKTSVALSQAPESVQAVISPVHFGENTLFLLGVGPADGETLVT